jgi:hypothetical protein
MTTIRREIHTDLSDDELTSRWKHEGGQDGFYLYTPRLYHLILTVTLFVATGFIIIPGTFLFKQAVIGLATLTFGQFGLACLLMAQAMARSSIEEEIDYIHYYLTHHGLHGVTRLFTAIAFGFAIPALVLSITGLVNCRSITIDSLAQLVVNNNNISLITLYHTPEFNAQLAQMQMCIDDYAITIAFMVIICVMLVLDVLIFFHESSLEGRTADIHRALSAANRVVTLTDKRDNTGVKRRQPLFGGEGPRL